MTPPSPPSPDSDRRVRSIAERNRLLRKEQRRVLLDVLHENPPPTDLSAAAQAVAERMHGRRVNPEFRHRVKIELHHVDIPILDEAGVVEYDTEDNRITEFRPQVSQS